MQQQAQVRSQPAASPSTRQWRRTSGCAAVRTNPAQSGRTATLQAEIRGMKSRVAAARRVGSQAQRNAPPPPPESARRRRKKSPQANSASRQRHDAQASAQHRTVVVRLPARSARVHGGRPVSCGQPPAPRRNRANSARTSLLPRNGECRGEQAERRQELGEKAGSRTSSRMLHAALKRRPSTPQPPPLLRSVVERFSDSRVGR